MTFDNTCKFIAENFSRDIATWLLGQPINLTQLDLTELSVEPIRADQRLNTGMEVTQVAQLTGLSVEQVQQLSR